MRLHCHDPDGIGHCDPNYGSGYYVTVDVDQPGIGGDDDPIENGDTGHVWIEVGYEGGESASGGLYPGLPGDLRDDSANGHGYDVFITLPISQEQYEAMVNQLEEDEQNPPPWTTSHHCADYALEFLEEHTDHVIESAPIQYPIGTGTGTSPGSVGQDIVDDYGGTYAPGSNAGGN